MDVASQPIQGSPIHDFEKETFYRKRFLQWIANRYHPNLIYYPGSGCDSLPKIVFGEEKVVHVSLEENSDVGGYFSRLGSGIKIIADMRKPPFRSDLFDVIILHDIPPETIKESMPGFLRVLKTGGITVIDHLLRPEAKSFYLKLFRTHGLQLQTVPRQISKSGLISFDITIPGFRGEVVFWFDKEKEAFPGGKKIVWEQTFLLFLKS